MSSAKRELTGAKKFCGFCAWKVPSNYFNEIGTQTLDGIENQKGLILTDDVTLKPINLEKYSNAIVKIVKESYPKFTIGIFGDWGTGKTTLMNLIEENIKGDKNTFIVKFEAWQLKRRTICINSFNENNCLCFT